jgi:cardiolipin synthase A/B
LDHRPGSRRSKSKTVVVTVVLTIVTVLLLLNLTLGDKHVDAPVKSLYAVHHPQFVRTMGATLGPALLPGNEVKTLVNDTTRPDC